MKSIVMVFHGLSGISFGFSGTLTGGLILVVMIDLKISFSLAPQEVPL